MSGLLGFSDMEFWSTPNKQCKESRRKTTVLNQLCAHIYTHLLSTKLSLAKDHMESKPFHRGLVKSLINF